MIREQDLLKGRLSARQPPLTPLFVAIFDLDTWRRLLRSLFSPKMLLVPFIGLFFYAWHVHGKVSSELELAALKASSALGHYFLNYQTAQSFQPDEILELVQSELDSEGTSLAKEFRGIFLQAIHREGRVLLDTRDQEILRFEDGEIPKISLTPSFGTWKNNQETFRYVDRAMLSDGAWTLRAVISRPDYLRRQFFASLTFLVLLTAAWLIVQFAVRYYEEAISRRRFDHLVRTVLQFSRKNEKALIESLPSFTCHLLEFDAAAVYLIKGDLVVPVAYESKEEKKFKDFLKATDEEPIKLDSDYPEAKVYRARRGRVQQKDPHVHKGMISDKPYIISPIISQRENEVIGLLTGERKQDLDREDLQRLNDLAMLVSVLIGDVRNARKVEVSHRQMIRMTRQVTLGTVVPVVAHNMRSPLTMIQLLVGDLSQKWDKFDREEIDDQLTSINHQSEQCLDLIQRILDYQGIGEKNRGKSGSAPNNLPMNPVKVLETSCGLFRLYLEIQNVRLTVEIEEGFQPLIEMDELDFHQVVTNLLFNADQAFPETDKSSKGYAIEVVMGEDPKADWVQIRVKDNGPGVPVELRGQIFADGFTTKGDKGTGVGLPYCRKVIENAGGEIHLETDTTSGACFLITLPTAME